MGMQRREVLRSIAGMVLADGLPGCGRRREDSRGIPMLTAHIRDEFGRLRSAIVHDGANAIDITLEEVRGLVPPDELQDHPETGPSGKARVIEQLGRFRELLRSFGVSIIPPVTQPDAFCQVFTRDPCFVIGETLFVGGLRDDYRHPERAGLADILDGVRSSADLSGEGAFIEGGDVIVLGEHVLVGSNRHTNESGYRRLSQALEGSGAQSIKVPHGSLHLDCCLAPLPNREALYAPGKLPEDSLHLLGPLFRRLIPLDRDEATLHLAANLVWLDEENVVSSVAAPKTNALLRSLGYTVHELDFSDLVSIWGSFRCVTCPIERM